MAETQFGATNWAATTQAAHRSIRFGRGLSQDIRATLTMLGKGLLGRDVTKAGGVLAFLLFAAAATAQSVPVPPLTTAATEARPTAQATAAQALPENLPGMPPKISYEGGLLKIDAFGSTLADVLTRVAALAGVTIDIPASAKAERMPAVELGPGPPRQILASLLSDSNFDYLIQSSETDPEKIQSVLLMPREKKGSGTNGVDPPGRRNPYVRAAATPAPAEETPAPESPLPAQSENAPLAAEAASLAQPDPSVPPPPTQPDNLVPLSQMNQSTVGRPASTLTPPSSLNPQSINQQLQQMYQQRVQMIQQGQTVTPTVHQ